MSSKQTTIRRRTGIDKNYHFHSGLDTPIGDHSRRSAMGFNPYATEERREPHDSILDEIGPGSMTKSSVVDALEGEYDEQAVKIALSDLITEGELEEHPDFEGSWRNPDAQ